MGRGSNQFAFHHLDRKLDFLAEAARVLDAGGRFTMRNLDPWSMKNWALYQYFPAALQRDLTDGMPLEEITQALRSAGFSNIRVHRRYQPEPVLLGELVADLRRRRDRSQLIALPDPDYEAGLARAEADLERRGPETPVPSEKCDVTLVAERG